jgi:hypothetical protein
MPGMHHTHYWESAGETKNSDGTTTYKLKCACGATSSKTM